MPVNPKRRQKKQEQRQAKRKVKHQQLVRKKHAGLPERLAAAAGLPIHESWVTEDLWDEGMGWVGLSRQLANGMIAVGVFLVDRYCLGVKDAVAEITSQPAYDSQIARKRGQFRWRQVSPETARRFVEEAVEYAADLGLRPHADYHKAKLIFGDLDPAAATEVLEYGKDGNPLFIAGPYDDPARCRSIMQVLKQSRGADGFHYLIPFGGRSDPRPLALGAEASAADDPFGEPDDASDELDDSPHAEVEAERRAPGGHA